VSTLESVWVIMLVASIVMGLGLILVGSVMVILDRDFESTYKVLLGGLFGLVSMTLIGLTGSIMFGGGA
jgi:hypothetical protein